MAGDFVKLYNTVVDFKHNLAKIFLDKGFILILNSVCVCVCVYVCVCVCVLFSVEEKSIINTDLD